MPAQGNIEDAQTPTSLKGRIFSALRSYPTLTLFLLAVAAIAFITNFLLVNPGGQKIASSEKQTGKTPNEEVKKASESATLNQQPKIISGTFISFDQKTQTLEIFTNQISKIAVTPQTKIIGAAGKDLSKVMPSSQLSIKPKTDSGEPVAEEILIKPNPPIAPPKPGGTQ